MPDDRLDEATLNQIFLEARTHNAWQDKPVSEDLLHELFNLMRMGPTSANMQPVRIVFVTSTQGKERLRPCLMEGNREKTMAAPACAILGYDTRFYEYMPKIFPHEPTARSWFDSDQTQAEQHAFRNSSLQGAYFIIAARSLGLDCGPMSGFDNAAVNKEFFPGGRVKSNFLCNIGYGDPAGLFDRSPRFEFDDVCEIA